MLPCRQNRLDIMVQTIALKSVKAPAGHQLWCVAVRKNSFPPHEWQTHSRELAIILKNVKVFAMTHHTSPSFYPISVKIFSTLDDFNS